MTMEEVTSASADELPAPPDSRVPGGAGLGLPFLCSLPDFIEGHDK